MKKVDTEHIREVFGQVLRKERTAQKLSQEELAFRSGLTMRYISLIECNNRQPTISSIYSLCSGLEISMSEFMKKVEESL